MVYQVYADGVGEWRWRLKADNGNVLADSGEGYAKKIDCYAGINKVKASSDAKVEET
ncbi:YegP family protein [Lacipirellula limnantheis]|uniref:DUF1508 domain-containing protein n=1 Tax=Lacipirellula limnantheis TaxID=2528024 RepID=A0A517TWK0_9BACT|nr:YegP family protein [Lacipirellula limnantheis]QDT72744.1 hypothetical protein I41_19270 [Lacipirellula limnantheis]